MEKKEKPTGEGRQAFDGANFPDKDRNISIETGLSIKKWINDNFCRFTDYEICSKFNLTIPELWAIYRGNFTVNYPKFSYCKAPIRNTIPTKEIDLLQVYRAISGTHYKKLTEQYRAMEPGAKKREFKETRFDYVIFGGTFTKRNITAVKKLSGYAAFDFDHLQEPEALKQLLIADENLNVQLCFISPSGDGLKMILFNDDGDPYDEFYSDVTNYLKSNYPSFAGTIDSKTKDTARACFICHDANCYIKSQYLELWHAEKN